MFLFLLCFLTLAAYFPALSGGFLWDDDAYLSENKTVTEPGRFSEIWLNTRANPQYYPLVFSSFWLEYRLWGLNTLGYHVVNVLLHLASTVLLWRLLLRLQIPGATLAALLFALHPVQVESVAWITERKNVLSGLFYFLALTAYVRFARLDENTTATSRAWGWYAAAFLAFAAALLSKSVTATLPAVLILILWWRRGRVCRTDILALAPMFVVGLTLGLHTAWLESTHVGAAHDDWSLSALQRGLVAGRALCFYVWKLLWPANLSFVYTRWSPDDRAVWQYSYPLIALACLAIPFALRARIGRGPFVALACFAGTLFPALGFLRVFPHRYSFVADHFQYLACVFLIVLFSSLAALWTCRLNRIVRITACSILVGALTVLTFRQARAYQNGGALWQDAIAKSPGAWMAHGNYADWLSLQGRPIEAIASYQRSLELKPDAPLIHYHLALALEAVDRMTDAERHYRQALQLEPNHLASRINLGRSCARRSANGEAEFHFRAAIEIDPTYEVAHYHLAHLLVATGRVDEGRRHYQEAIRLIPDYWEARINDAAAAWSQGKIDEAANLYQETIRRNPSSFEAHVNLGALRLQRGSAQEAVPLLERATALRPDNIDARLQLARAFDITGRTMQAIEQYRAILSLAPDHAEARQALARLAARSD